jgi:5'-methylthioadenosine phosphorylase
MIAIIGGTALAQSTLGAGGNKVTVHTPYGTSELLENGSFVYLQRHGQGIPPHMINHKANIYALKQYTGLVVGVGSVGSLKKGLKPPSLVAPTDFLQFNPPTFFDSEIRHTTPGFDEQLRTSVIKSAKKAKVKVLPKGVYAQMPGPRLETRAEVRMLSAFADVVGMTLASEATLACELGMRYAALCSVDNLANGLAKKALTFEQIKSASAKNQASLEKILRKVIGDGR